MSTIINWYESLHPLAAFIIGVLVIAVTVIVISAVIGSKNKPYDEWD